MISFVPGLKRGGAVPPGSADFTGNLARRCVVESMQSQKNFSLLSSRVSRTLVIRTSSVLIRETSSQFFPKLDANFLFIPIYLGAQKRNGHFAPRQDDTTMPSPISVSPQQS